MKKTLAAMSLAFAFALAGCGGSSNSNGSGGGSGGTGGGTSNQTCNEMHDCINGSCTCTAGPNKNNSCCDPNDSTCTNNKCDTYCHYCM